ncbi:MAG: alpha/beta hydrolase [Selenomonadaceae bacterium]|nr:alpha/beta hydrolase [Selenomonadaceae bacterium]
MKKIFVAAIILLLGAGYFIGNYFVDFALKRGDDLSPPKACANIADPNLKAPPVPNFPEEDWTLESFDGLELYARKFSPAEKTNRWAILVHGYGRDGTYAYDYAEEYLKRGWNVLIPDLRAAGKSQGEFITMGALECRDVFDWSEKVSADNPDAKIILHGVSMGAATVLMTAALEPKNLCAVVEDCGYTSAYEMFTAQLEKIFGLPEYPVMPCANIVCKIKTGIKISDAAPIDSVDKIKVPILFIHGDADGLVPFEMMGRLYDKATAPKEKFIVEGAGHADAKRKNPAVYFDKVFKFLEETTQ